MRPQAYRPQRPTPAAALVAIIGLVLAAGAVAAIGWLALVALLTWRALP